MVRSTNQAKLQLWKSRFEQFAKSQLSVQQFCRSVGCSVASYYHWKRKLQASDTAEFPCVSQSMPGFIPVTIRQDEARVVSIELPGGTKIQLPTNAIEALRLVIEHDQRAA